MELISRGDDEGDGGDEHHREGEQGEELCEVAGNTKNQYKLKIKGCWKYKFFIESQNKRLLEIQFFIEIPNKRLLKIQ